MLARWGLTIAVISTFGCGSAKFAPVSGKVLMDGRPLAGATVSFQPVAPPGTMEAGPGSSAVTDDNGNFVLKAATGENGAWVGKHQVRISLLSIMDEDGDARPVRGGPRQIDKIPAKYNARTELTFDVPSGGSEKADFDLKSR